MSEEFEFSFSYPSDWIIEVTSPQRVDVVNSLGIAAVSIDVEIFRVPSGLDEYTSVTLGDFEDALLDFEVVSSSEVSQDSREAQQAVFEWTAVGERETWKGKIQTLTSGHLGFVVSGVTPRAVFDTYESTLDAILASVTLPGIEFTPPAPAITNATLATGIDEFTQEPFGTGTKFSSGTNQLYTFVMVHNGPVESTVEFAWVQVDARGNQIKVIDRTGGEFRGTGSLWAWIESERGLRPGWYESQVFVDDELLVTLPFTIDLTEFLNERLGVAFSYPSGWTIDDSNPGLMQLRPPLGGLVQVATFMIGPRTLDAVVSEWAEGITSLGFREVSRVTFDGEVPGYLLRFEVSFDTVPVVFDTVLTVAGARLFSVSLAVAETLLDSLLADFELLTDSFNIALPPTRGPVDDGAGVSEIQDAIERRVVAVRGLEAGAPVQTGFQAREEYRAETSSESPDEKSKQEIDKVKDFCLVLDLCKESDDLLETSRDLTAEGVLGYYDPEEKSFIVIGDEDTFGASKWMTYAHEYTHALQDEHFDLSMLKSEEETSDSAKAIGALVEGDANLVEYLFYESLPPEPQVGLATSFEASSREFSESPQVAEAPRILTETFGWEHSAGLDFVFRLYLEGGFDAVDKAYENLPRSTEQILHPEKYLSGEGPHDVTVPVLALALGNGWHQTDTGVLGELLTGIYLGTFLPEDQTDSAAEGWGGDHYVLLKDDQGRRLMALRFSWDSEEDAVEFFEAYVDLVEEKSEGLWDLTVTDGTKRMWLGEDIGVYLGLGHEETLVVIGPDGVTVEAAVREFPSLPQLPTPHAGRAF